MSHLLNILWKEPLVSEPSCLFIYVAMGELTTITDLTWSEAIFGNRIVWDSSGSLLYQIISMSDFGSGVS